MKRSLMLILLIMCAMYIVLSNVNYENYERGFTDEESYSISEEFSVDESTSFTSDFVSSDL